MIPRWILHHVTYAETLWKHAYAFAHIVVNEINANVASTMLLLAADEFEFDWHAK
jgi:hypothetical protein